MSDRDTGFEAYFAGFIIGGLVGAAAALLLAPQSGEETRTLIRDKSVELKDKASESAEEARLRMVETVDDLRERVDELSASVGKQTVEVDVEVVETTEESE